jgi:type I restriction enzyme R subunit
VKKETFKLFDFFAVCEYFEEKYNYDQVLNLPKPNSGGVDVPPVIDPRPKKDGFDNTGKDYITTFKESIVSESGMKVDRMFFNQFEETVKQDADILKQIQDGNIETAIGIAADRYLDAEKTDFSLEKLRRSLKIDRKISIRELLEMIFFGNEIKGRQELISDEFDKFISTIDLSHIKDLDALRYFFYAYLTDPSVRKIIDNQEFTELYHHPTLSVEDYSRVEDAMKKTIPSYIKTYLPIEKFATA